MPNLKIKNAPTLVKIKAADFLIWKFAPISEILELQDNNAGQIIENLGFQLIWKCKILYSGKIGPNNSGNIRGKFGK